MVLKFKIMRLARTVLWKVETKVLLRIMECSLQNSHTSLLRKAWVSVLFFHPFGLWYELYPFVAYGTITSVIWIIMWFDYTFEELEKGLNLYRNPWWCLFLLYAGDAVVSIIPMRKIFIVALIAFRVLMFILAQNFPNPFNSKFYRVLCHLCHLSMKCLEWNSKNVIEFSWCLLLQN